MPFDHRAVRRFASLFAMMRLARPSTGSPAPIQVAADPPNLYPEEEVLRGSLILLPMLLIACVFVACSASTEVAFVNPTDQVMFVQVNERAAFEVAPNATAKASLPSVERLTPITITARDARGETLFFVSTSVTSIENAGRTIRLQPQDARYDPLTAPYYRTTP